MIWSDERKFGGFKGEVPIQRWKSALEGKGLKVNIGKAKMMLSGTESAIALSKIDPYGICGKGVLSNAVCCTL